MKTTTAAYKRIIASGGSRNFLINVDITLTDGTRLTLTEEDIWADSFSIDTASSGKSSLDIGYAVIGQCSFQIENFDERFNPYDFFNASAVVWVKLEGDTQYYRMGFFTVDEPEHNGILISLILLNNMWKFDDKNLSEVGLSFPCSCQTAITTVCAFCGVTLATSQFHGYQFTLTKAPEKDMNCREFIQYVAMIGCNFCIIDDTGALRLKWYDVDSWVDDLDGGTFDTHTTPYSDGDIADGGNFLVYEETKDYDGGSFLENTTVAYFTRIFGTPQIGTDEINVTGVKIEIDETTYMVGTEGYVIDLKENPLLTASNVNAALNLIWDVLRGFRFRTFDITTLPDLAVEIGDCCAIRDAHGNYVHSYITNNSFGFSNHQVSLGAITPMRSLVKQYSKTVQAAVEIARKRTDEAISTYDVAVQLMNTLAINAMGAYQDYEDIPTGGRIYYLSNMPITKVSGVCQFTPESTVFKISGSGFFVSTQGGLPDTWDNGYDPETGALLVNILKAIGLEAEWIVTGLLRDKNNNNSWNLDTGDFKLSAATTVGGKTVQAIANTAAATAEANAEATAARELANAVTAISGSIGDLQSQVDGKAETWYQDTDPSTGWTEHGTGMTIKFNSACEVENTHDYIDIYWKEDNGNTYSKIKKTGAFGNDTITIPATEFWVHWHTDFSVTKWGWKIDSIKGYGGSSFTPPTATASVLPSLTPTDKLLPQMESDHPYVNNIDVLFHCATKVTHEGDLWYKTTDDTTWYYDGTTWIQQNIPVEVFNKINKKAQIFTSTPVPPYYVNDMWIVTDSSDANYGEMLTCINPATTTFLATDWIKKNKYTDDSAVTNMSQYDVWRKLTGNSQDCITLNNGVLGIKATAIATGLLASRENAQYPAFSLNMDTGAMTMNSGTFRGLVAAATVQGSTIQGGSININNMFTVDSSGNVNAKSGNIGDLTLESGELYKRGTYTLYGSKRYIIYRKSSIVRKNFKYFYPNRLDIKDSSFQITITYTNEVAYSGTIYVDLEEKNGSSWDEVTWIKLSNEAGTFTQTLNYTFYNWDSARYRLQLEIHEYTDRHYMSVSAEILNVKVISLSANAIWGTHRGSFIGTGTFDSVSVGELNIDSFGIDSSGLSTDEYIQIFTTGMSLREDSSNYFDLNPGHLYGEENGTYKSVTWSSSDRRLKENIRILDIELSKSLIDATEPKKFKYKNLEGEHYGMIAQEAREILDKLGETDAQLEHSMDIQEPKFEDPRTIDYCEYVPHLVNYVKDLRAEIEALKEEIKTLKGEN